MKKRYGSIIYIFIALLVTANAWAQKKQVKQFEKIIGEAVKKAYPASVRMWGFDVQQNQRTSAQFSGVVVSADGYILTAAHTTVPGKNYKVFFPDGKECIALALGRIDNPKTPGMPDVAMMKITDNGLWPFAEMGYSGTLQVNEPCISISYPETLNQTLPTLRLGEVAEVKNTYGFIRSTCKMEPGDSGGPLFDYHGRVIGLHSAIDVAEDQNFEIPVDLYRKYWTALQKERTYTSFPDQQDSIGTDPLAAVIQKENQQKRLHPDLQKAAKKNTAGVALVSALKGKTQEIQGTLFNTKDRNGKQRQFVVTKLSLLGEKPKLLSNSEVVPLIVLKDKANDLALLELKSTIKGGIDLEDVSTDSSIFSMGKMLYSAKTDGQTLPSVSSSKLFSLPKQASQPYLGAMVMFNSEPAQFSLIKPDGPAATVGIKVGDELVSINGKAVAKASEFAPEILKLWPDDEVTITWKNETGTVSRTFALAQREQLASNHPAEKFMGGKSVRRDGFLQVFAHDGAIENNQCGSPVFDFQGNFLGINIARFSRTSTLVMPAYLISQLIKQTM